MSNYWESNCWHHSVHQQLGETLQYYLARIRPFDLSKSVRALEVLVKKHKLGSIRVFPLFGPYDLLVRIWAHPMSAVHLREQLGVALGSADPLCPFFVRGIQRRWYWRTDDAVDREAQRLLLVTLNDDAFRQIQEGGPRADGLRSNLQKHNLIVDRKTRAHDTIKFFLAVNLKNDSADVRDAIVTTILTMLDNNTLILDPSVYSGWGYFSVLVKAQVALEDYFLIGELGTNLAKLYHSAGASTETYLVDSPGHAYKVETIGQSTFAAIQGVDLFVNGILPELYQTEYSRHAIEEIVRFLRAEAQELQLSTKVTKIVHDYLLSYLERDEITMATSLLSLFMSFERYINNVYPEFVARYSVKDLKSVYKEAQEIEDRSRSKERNRRRVKQDVAEAEELQGEGDDLGEDSVDGKRVGLWKLLTIMSIAIESPRSNEEDMSDLAWKWEDVTEVRNGLGHYRYNLLRDWQTPLSVAVRALPRMRQLIAALERVTGKGYDGIK